MYNFAENRFERCSGSRLVLAVEVNPDKLEKFGHFKIVDGEWTAFSSPQDP